MPHATTCVAVLVLAPLAQAAIPAGSELDSLLVAADAAYDTRDQTGRLDEVEAKLLEAQKLAPEDFEVLWRLARYYFWISDDPELPDGEKSKLGKRAWDLGEQALARSPDRVEGHYFAALGMGNYSLGIGVLKALTQGIEGKFKKRLGAAERLDAAYEGGGCYNAWGRFYYELPWPKYDASKSEDALRKAVQVHPPNLRARLYLADLYLKEDEPKEAKKLVEGILAAKPGAYDRAEELRVQEMARSRLPDIEKALK